MSALTDTLNRINWHYGKGSIVAVAHDDTGGNVRIDRPHCAPIVRYFTFPKEGFVRFCGQTRLIRSH